MTPYEREHLPLKLEQLYREIGELMMEDVVRRIDKAGKITSTADYQLNRIMMMGGTSAEIEREIQRRLDLSYEQVYKMYDDVIDMEYTRNKDIYEQINLDFLPYEENYQLQQLSRSLIGQTLGELQNFTKSAGFAVDYGNGLVFMPMAEYYQKYLDRSLLSIVTGAVDYNTALRTCVTQMTNSGIRVVDYASGHSNRIDVAARRAVMTGISQLTGRISDYNAESLGVDTYEVAWHSGARNTGAGYYNHQSWQGQVYTKDQLTSICGLGYGGGLLGWNCYHEYYPYYPGLSKRNWSDDWLEDMNTAENTLREYNGKWYDMYQATQKQRHMETAMRAQREKVRLLQKGRAEKETIENAQIVYNGQLYEYARFSNQMNLKQQRERIYLDMRGRVATNTKKNAKYTPEMIKNADTDSKQYKKYKEILGKDVGSLANFRQMKYNEPRKYEALKKKWAAYSEINKKEWTDEFKQKSKEIYNKFSDEGINLSVHALSRIPRLNKPGIPEVTEKELMEFIKGVPKYKEGSNKLIYFDAERQLVVVKNNETGDIVSIVRRKSPKEMWESV